MEDTNFKQPVFTARNIKNKCEKILAEDFRF
jgi:hypothetical protein